MNYVEIMMDAITEHNGTTFAHCDFCGRTWFTSRCEEVESMRERQKEKPDKYIESGDDGLGFGWIDGKQYVYGCCEEKVKRYADWVWGHRTIIMSYLKKRAASNAEQAARDLAEVSESDR